MILMTLIKPLVQIDKEDVDKLKPGTKYQMAWMYEDVLWVESILVDFDGDHYRYSESADDWNDRVSAVPDCDIVYLIHESELTK